MSGHRGRGFGQAAKKPRGGSASGYSYFNRNSNKSDYSASQGWGDDSWGYQGYHNQQWSPNGGYGEYGYDASYGNHDKGGWQNYESSHFFNTESVGNPARFFPGPRNAGMRGNNRNVIERKRPRETKIPLLGRSPKRIQHEPNFYGNLSSNAQMGDFNPWGEAKYGGFDNDWAQLPGSSRWGGGDFSDQNSYTLSLGYGGYGGGYGDPKRYQEPKHSTWKAKKEADEHHEKWKKKKDSPDDKLIYRKHRSLTQMDEKKNILHAVRSIMGAMKSASETLSVEAKAELEVAESKTQQGNTTDESNLQDHSKPEKGSSAPPQVLLGVIRVGPAQRKLIVKDAIDHAEELVAVFKDKPQKHMVHRLASLIEFNLKGVISEKAIISANDDTEMISVNLEKFDCKYPILISLTSSAYDSEEPEADTVQPQCDSELLSEDKCRQALSKIRRVRWRKQAKEELELPVVRIFMDFGRRLPGWNHMSSYAAEVLVNAVIEKLAKDVRESEHTVSRVFIQCIEVLAAGLALTIGPGLKDPCETKSTDLFSKLSQQDAEDLTKAAQCALRMYSCGQLKNLLGTD